MMKLPLFYYPTTLMCVDDDLLFLEATTQLFEKSYSVKVINGPKECLDFFENYVSPIDKIQLRTASIEHEQYETVNHQPIDFDVPSLSKLHNYQERSQEISVLVIDYEMPKMNGIEVCKKLSNQKIKKILLTGRVDEREAIDAFNLDVIDRYLRKDSPTLSEDLTTYITNLSNEFFSDKTSDLLAHLEVDHPTPMSDPIFVKFFLDFCDTYKIKEYILIDKNGSFSLKNEKNEYIQLVVHTDRSLDLFTKFNEDVRESEEVLSKIRDRKIIPFFGIGKESWEFPVNEWPKFMREADVIRGRHNYHWSICL